MTAGYLEVRVVHDMLGSGFYDPRMRAVGEHHPMDLVQFTSGLLEGELAYVPTKDLRAFGSRPFRSDVTWVWA